MRGSLTVYPIEVTNVSDDTRREYARLTGESPPAPLSSGRKGFGSLRTTFILLGILVALFVAERQIRQHLIMVQPGHIVLCVEDEVLTPIREPGMAWCQGEAYVYVQQRRLTGEVNFNYSDGLPGAVKLDLLYSIPEQDDWAWDPVVKIHLQYHSQEKFERDAMQRAILSAVVNVFGSISARTILQAPREAGPLIHEGLVLNIRGALLQENITVQIDQLIIKGRALIPVPSPPQQQGSKREISL